VRQNDFLKKYNERRPLIKEGVYKWYIDKYNTILNWLCVSYNGKEIFWQNTKRYYIEDKLDCYETRLEKIINTCTRITSKYWGTQRNISDRKNGIKLFEEKIFKNRKTEFQDKKNCFGKGTNFNIQVLYELKWQIQVLLGYRF
jgi:hypothetical protein